MTKEPIPVNCGCGGEAKVYNNEVRWEIGIPHFVVECDNCGIITKWHHTEAEAIQAWNRAMSGNIQYVAVFGDINAQKSKTVG